VVCENFVGEEGQIRGRRVAATGLHSGILRVLLYIHREMISDVLSALRGGPFILPS